MVYILSTLKICMGASEECLCHTLFLLISTFQSILPMINPFQRSTTPYSFETPMEVGVHQEEEKSEGNTMFTLPTLKQVGDTAPATALSTTKRVTFDRKVKVREHLHLSDISDNEHDAVWYTEDEMTTMRAECCQAIQMLNSNKKVRNYVATEEETILSCDCRGLEYRTKAGSKLRYEHRLTAWEVVELEQDRQWNDGTFDDDKLADVYHTCVDASSRVAHLLALRDQQWVQEHKDDTPTLPWKSCPPICLTVSSNRGKRRGSKHRHRRTPDKSEQTRCITSKTLHGSTRNDTKSATAMVAAGENLELHDSSAHSRIVRTTF